MATTSPKVLVVVGFAEALSAPEVVWSLVDSGCKVIAFSRKGRRAALRHSRHVTFHEITAPEKDCAASLMELAAVLESSRNGTQGHHVLLPLDDSSVWLCSLITPSSGWILAGPCGNCVELALNKQQQIQAAKATGFNVPATTVVSTVEDLAAYTPRFPVILRPANAVLVHENRLWKGRNWICSDKAELNLARSAWNGSCPLLIQPFLEGNGEGVFGLATKNGVVAWSAHRRLRMMNPHGSGSSACISQAVPNDVRSHVEAFLQSSGWRGMFMVELLRTQDGRLWFIEFNGRAWGSMALSRRQSLEYPAWTVSLFLDPQALPDYDSSVVEEVVCRNLGRELMHALFVLRGPQSRAIQRWPSLLDTFHGVFLDPYRSSFYNLRKDDWRVFVSDCWYTIRDQVFKAK